MSFLDSLENLRRSSVEKRRAVLIILVIICMAATIGLWILQLGYSASNYRSEGNQTKPFELLSVSARDTLDVLKESLRSIYERK